MTGIQPCPGISPGTMSAFNYKPARSLVAAGRVKGGSGESGGVQSLVQRRVGPAADVDPGVGVPVRRVGQAPGEGLGVGLVLLVALGVKLAPQRRREQGPAAPQGEGPVVGFIGSFYDYEGLDDLIAAMPMLVERVPGAKLLMVGASR